MSVGKKGLSILRRIASMTYIGFEKKTKMFWFFWLLKLHFATCHFCEHDIEEKKLIFHNCIMLNKMKVQNVSQNHSPFAKKYI
jgi:hypothetical protein